jgi:hypothetical protein
MTLQRREPLTSGEKARQELVALAEELLQKVYELSFEQRKWSLFAHPVYALCGDDENDLRDDGNGPDVDQNKDYPRTLRVFLYEGEELDGPYELESIDYCGEEVVNGDRRWMEDRQGVEGWNWTIGLFPDLNYDRVMYALNALLKHKVLDELADA